MMMRRLAAFLRRCADLLEGRPAAPAAPAAPPALPELSDIELAEHLTAARLLERAFHPHSPRPTAEA